MSHIQKEAMYACKEHIEIVIDQYVEEFGLAPDLFPWEVKNTESAVCKWCQSSASYLLVSSNDQPS